uniref:Putative metalloprotease n=1 Tax=Pithovirus LCPAC001 TaxID=2506585 RepID=A0A481Z3K8_9VIRU|nr:MAG: putative metalloprotease [Pithovirus LCPAC001]
MYLARTNQNNRYVNGVFPSVRIEKPIPMEHVSYEDFRLLIVTKSCRLGHNNYYFTIFINDVQYMDKYYTDGYIPIKGFDLDLGQLQITVKLYYGNGLVYEDCVTVISYHPDIDYKDIPCDPIIEKAEACDPVVANENAPCEVYESSQSICESDVENTPCEVYESSQSMYESDGENKPCEVYESSQSMYESDGEGPCDVYESSQSICESMEEMECDEKLTVIMGPSGPCGPPGPKGEQGDGGIIKKVYKSKRLSPKVRTYIVKNSEHKEIVLTLPESYYQRDKDCKNIGHVVTIYNDSCKQTLVQAPCDYKLKDVRGFFLLNPAQSATFHNLKKKWYVVSK